MANISSRNSAIRVGIVLEAQIWELDLRYNRSSAFILVCVKLETNKESRKVKGEICQALSRKPITKHSVQEAEGIAQMLRMHGSFHEQQEGPAVARGTKTEL